MGKFIYGTPSIAVDFDDRVLAHLKVVILSKVRRGESFTFSWEYTASSGSGHSSIWIHPAIPLQFDFLGAREPRLNRAWVEELVQLANTPSGLRVTSEPTEGEPEPNGKPAQGSRPDTFGQRRP
jgi:hypothetical protein